MFTRSYFLFAGYSFLLIFSGWQICTYYNGYKENLENKALQIVKDGISEYQKVQAQGLEDTKVLLQKQKSSTIIKERTIVEKPIYQNVCLDEDGVSILRDYKTRSAEIIGGKK